MGDGGVITDVVTQIAPTSQLSELLAIVQILLALWLEIVLYSQQSKSSFGPVR